VISARPAPTARAQHPSCFDSNKDKNNFKQSLKNHEQYKRHAALQCDHRRIALTKVMAPLATLTFCIDLR